MPQIVVPKEFFIKERQQVYAEWPRAFFRELFSNSVDAGATEISVSFEALTNKSCSVVFADNGIGMTRDILDNVYFHLGASTKDKEKGIGGFGRARILTNFSHEEYEIITQDNKVRGAGSHYEYLNNGEFEFFEGCVQKIKAEITASKMKRHLIAFLHTCNFSCKVYVDGKEWTNKFIGTKFLMTLPEESEPIAKLYHVEDKELDSDFKANVVHTLFIRVNGCCMYSEPFPGKNAWIIELEPERSREFLTASRDSVRDSMKMIIETIRKRVQSSEAEMVKQLTYQFKEKLFEGNGPLSVRGQQAKIRQTNKEDNQIVREIEYSLVAQETLIRNVRMREMSDQLEMSSLPSTGTTKYKISEFIPDIPAKLVSYLPAMIAAMESFDPSKWEFSLVGDKLRLGEYREYWNLYVAWETCVTYCAQVLVNKGPWHDYQLRYRCGFIFDEDLEGLNQYGKSIYEILMRPVNKDGFIRFNPNSLGDFIYILEIAKHEVTHCFQREHDEDFIKQHFSIGASINPMDVYKKFKTYKV